MTSFESAGWPVGSGAFQSIPNAVRSTVAVSFRPKRSLPYGSAAGSAIVPRSSTGSVWPLIVISPRTVTSFPERSISCEAKVSCGCRS